MASSASTSPRRGCRSKRRCASCTRPRPSSACGPSRAARRRCQVGACVCVCVCVRCVCSQLACGDGSDECVPPLPSPAPPRTKHNLQQPSNKKNKKRKKNQKNTTGHSESVLCVAFSPDGRRLASGSGDTTVRFWDLTTQLPKREGRGQHKNWVLSVAWSPDGAVLASGDMDGAIWLWDGASGAPLGACAGHKKWITSLVCVCFVFLLFAGCRAVPALFRDATQPHKHHPRPPPPQQKNQRSRGSRRTARCRAAASRRRPRTRLCACGTSRRGGACSR